MAKQQQPLPTGGMIQPISIEHEMRSSYIEYAMSVIVGRALPDVRDGLKPVHRRILYAMYEQGMLPTRPYKKSARVVGEVLGKYHPHGDVAVYDTMVRMAQDFSIRYPLVDGQGNFGSVDGDAAAAMRYTEARLSHLAVETLSDIEKETVDWVPNFDNSLEEPSVLPAKVPNLLLNGSAGIAVGMATNIPPHNMSELTQALITLLEEPDAKVADIMKIMPGPDFPTGGLICGRSGIKEAYETGRGLLTLRAKIEIEELKGGKEAIIVGEIPYQVNKSQLLEKISDLVREKKINGISDLRDESDRQGMRIYIELRREANREVVLNQLFKHTPLEVTFGINLLALQDGAPKTLTILDMMKAYLGYRVEVITRRTNFDLKKAKEKAHILEGLRICLANLDAVIKLIKASKTVEDARKGLKEKFKLSEVQAQAILDMKLQRLTGLEREKIEEEYKATMAIIADLEDILAKPKRISKIIKDELLELKANYGDRRRTQITGEVAEVEVEDLIPEEEIVILKTKQGFIKRVPVKTFRAQLRGGRGINAMVTREEDITDLILVTTTHRHVLFFTSRGRVYRLKAYEIPDASRQSKGLSLAGLLTSLERDEIVTAIIALPELHPDYYLFMATRTGIVKKTSLSDFQNIRRSGIIAISLDKDDYLGWVRLTNGQQEVMIASSDGQAIRFSEKDVRPMGRSAAGVRGIRLRKGAVVVSMDLVKDAPELIAATARGFGKRTPVSQFRKQRRGGSGVRLIKLRGQLKDRVVTLRAVAPEDEILMVTSSGVVNRTAISGISMQSRAASGVILMRLDSEDSIVDVTRVKGQEEGKEDEESVAAGPAEAPAELLPQAEAQTSENKPAKAAVEKESPEKKVKAAPKADDKAPAKPVRKPPAPKKKK